MKHGLFFFLAFLTNFSIAQAEPVKVGSSPVISSAGIYLALEKGYFKEEGLEVDVTDIASSGAAMTLLLSQGQLDVGAGNLSSGLFNSILKGEKFKLVADKGHVSKDTDYICLIVRQDHLKSGRFKTLKDLKGMKLGLTALDGVSQEALLDRFLQKAGLTSKDVELVKLSYGEMNAALKTKALDATVQVEPFVTQAELGDFAKIVAKGSEVHPAQQSAALFFSPQFMSKRRDDAVKFMAAYLKGVRLYNQSLKDAKVRDEVTSLLKKRIKIDDDRVWKQMIPIGLNDDGKLNVSALQEDLDWYKSKGYLKGALKASDVVDHSFVEEAAKRIDGKK